MSYRYFLLPHAFSKVSEGARNCDVCGETAICYEGGVVGGSKDAPMIESVCDECLRNGRLLHLGYAVGNGADEKALTNALIDLYPDAPKSTVARLAAERTEELLTRTPHPSTWQDFDWPIHCGDYCRFEREAGKLWLLKQLSVDELRKRLGMADWPEEEFAGWWSSVPDADLTQSGRFNSIGVYAFRCLTCGEVMLHWDCP